MCSCAQQVSISCNGEDIEMNSCIHGYHIFKTQRVKCKGNQETQETAQYAVAIYKGDEIAPCSQIYFNIVFTIHLSGMVDRNHVFFFESALMAFPSTHTSL